MNVRNKQPMRRRLDLVLTRVPSFYARLIALRACPNLDKIVFLALVRRGDVVLDVGANVGFYTLLLSDLAGPRGLVHAFEPVPDTFEQLSHDLGRLGRFDNVVLNRLALAEQAGVVTMFVPDRDHGQASLARHAAGSWTRPTMVTSHSCQALTMDGYAAAREMRGLNFLKCDVEGAELPVLQGGIRTIQEFLPILYLEASRAWAAAFGYGPSDLLGFLAPLGYSCCYWVTDTGIHVADPTRLAFLVGDDQGSVNLLCCNPDRHGERLNRLRHWLPSASEDQSR